MKDKSTTAVQPLNCTYKGLHSKLFTVIDMSSFVVSKTLKNNMWLQMLYKLLFSKLSV